MVGDLFPETLAPYMAVMATSTMPKSWPSDPYGFRRWPGRWARDTLTGKAVPGMFASDEELFFAFTDRGYANRTFKGARGYEIGAKVNCQVRAFADSYAASLAFYELEAINLSSWCYWGVYLGVFWYVEACPPRGPCYHGEVVDYLLSELDAKSQTMHRYDMGYWYKRPEMVEQIRVQLNDPHLVVPYAGVSFLETPSHPSDGEPGLTGWHRCQPYQKDQSGALVNYLERKDRDLWQYKVLSGDTAGLSPELKAAFFLPDSSGALDPHFDRHGVSASVGESWSNCFLMSTGPFDWRAGDTLRLVFALVMGDDLEDLKRNARTAQRMYELGYQRSGPPPAP
ncbi:MAG: hypothetical protein H5U38_14020, partial [Calditrichaeota bacterium]|nr:hypothetical protein [Calditrichota bacterium]